MKKYLQIAISTGSQNEAEILASILADLDFYAFEEENNLLNAYIHEEDFDEEKFKEFLPPGAFFTKNIIEEENWNQQWESGISPVIVNDFAAIRTEFHAPLKNVKHELVITPKMSFGTGHHATTFLMIELMKELDFNNKTVIDFGTGTGVLAILAEKCGASKVTAIDLDEWSIENARENIAANNCFRITVNKQDDLSGAELTDIILANINLNVLKNCSSSLTSLLKTGSVLLVSGFLVPDEAEMQLIFEKENVIKKQAKQRGEWLAILFEKQ